MDDKINKILPAIVAVQLSSSLVHETNSAANIGVSVIHNIKHSNEFKKSSNRFKRDIHKIEDCLLEIGDHLSRYLRLKNNISNLSNLNLNFSHINIIKIIDEVLFSISAELAKKQINVKTILPKSLNSKLVLVDKGLMKLALRNLIQNSIFWVNEEGNITIKSFVRNKDIHIVIEDDGKGIDSTIQKSFFEPYITSLTEGFGLGLFIAKYITEELHGGDLRLLSSKNPTSFELRMPIKMNSLK